MHTEGSNNRQGKLCKLTVLHQNICSIRHKITELEVLLSTELRHIDVIYLTEHWQNDQAISSMNICNFKLASAFCRRSSNHGGAGIYVTEGLHTREIKLFTKLCEEKNFEMSLIELPKHKLTIVCIYRSPDGQLEKFINNLDVVIRKLSQKNNKSLLLCGDWNIDFLKEDNSKKDLTEQLLRYNLVNTIEVPTRRTTNSKSLLDVIIVEKNIIITQHQC